MDKGIQKTMTSRDMTRMTNVAINGRSMRLKEDRLKQNALNSVNTNDTKKWKKMTKKAWLVATLLLEKRKQAPVQSAVAMTTHPVWQMMSQ